jgi:hypothetical protein
VAEAEAAVFLRDRGAEPAVMKSTDRRDSMSRSVGWPLSSSQWRVGI